MPPRVPGTLRALMPLLAVSACSPEPVCVRSTVVDAYFEAKTQPELDALAGCEELHSLGLYPPDLFGDPITDLSSLSSVRVVRHMLSLRIPGVTTLAPLAGLTTVGAPRDDEDDEGSGYLSVEESGLTDLHGLENVGLEGDLRVISLLQNERLSTLAGLPSLPHLVELRLNQNDNLVDLEGAGGLEAIDILRCSSARLSSLDGLADDVVLGRLEVRGGRLTDLRSLPPSASLAALSLGTIDSFVEADLGGMSSLTSVGLGSLPALTRVAVPPPGTGDNDALALDLSALSALTDLEGLDAHAVLSSLVVVDNDVLPALPLAGLQRVVHGVHITFNGALSQAAIEERFATVDVGGDVKIAANSAWVVPAACPFVEDGQCDEPDVCASGTDTDDCPPDGGD